MKKTMITLALLVSGIALADTEHHLGNADMSRIDFVRLGWREGSLV